jgi:2-methylcitrate dehydratase PrpD
MSDETRTLAEFVSGLSYADLPEPVAERAKLLLLDTVGIAVRARHDVESTAPILAGVAELGLAGRGATVLGEAESYAPPAAALVNGAFAHSLDFDDTHIGASLHPSAPVVPAALAACEMNGAGGADLVTAIVAGYETVCRVSMALQPPQHYERGLHPTATAGTFGAAAAAGCVLGLSTEQMDSAFGVCGSQAAGSLQFLANGAWNKRLQVGAAAMNGLIAAVMARHGFVGAAEALEGRYGFLRAYAPNPVFERVTAELGSRWETMHIGVKPYPSCRFTHPAVDAILALHARHDFAADDIEAVTIGLSDKGLDLVGRPQEKRRRARNVVDGQFSMHFVGAVALSEGRFVWDSYRFVGDPAIDALCDRIDVVVDPVVEEIYPTKIGGRVTVKTGLGEISDLVEVPKGEPENFLSDAEMRAKFLGLVEPYVAAEAGAALADSLLGLERESDIGGLLRRFAAAPTQPQAAATGD